MGYRGIALALGVIAFTQSAAWGRAPTDFFCKRLDAAAVTKDLLAGIGNQAAATLDTQEWEKHTQVATAIGTAVASKFGEPQFFSKDGAGGCVANRSGATGICQQRVQCALVTQADKEALIEDSKGKDKSLQGLCDKTQQQGQVYNDSCEKALLQIPANVRFAYYSNSKNLDFRMSSVTCASKGTDCPDPEDCKADIEPDGKVVANAPLASVPLGQGPPVPPSAKGSTAGSGGVK